MKLVIIINFLKTNEMHDLINLGKKVAIAGGQEGNEIF